MTELPDMITIPAGRFIMGTVGEDRFAELDRAACTRSRDR